MNYIPEYKGYHTKVEYSVEDQVFYGKIEGIKDLVNFESVSLNTVEEEFHKAVDDYLARYESLGESPGKPIKDESMSITDSAIDYIRGLFQGNSGGHDAEHTLRVYRNALLIASQEQNCDLEIVSLAALLHDVDDHKLFHTENNANARSFLAEHGISETKINLICDAVNSVSFSQNLGRKPETIEGKIVQDADRLDALGAIGIARTFAYGGEHGRSIESSVQHFHDKLLLLKDQMNTAAGRKMAEERHAFLLTFLNELHIETDL